MDWRRVSWLIRHTPRIRCTSFDFDLAPVSLRDFDDDDDDDDDDIDDVDDDDGVAVDGAGVFAFVVFLGHASFLVFCLCGGELSLRSCGVNWAYYFC